MYEMMFHCGVIDCELANAKCRRLSDAFDGWCFEQ